MRGINDLNLSSTARSVPGSAVVGSGGAVIMVDGRPQAVSSTTNLTPAAALAAAQVLASGRQNLMLNASQAAIAGTLVLNQSAAAISSMVIPSGVRVLQGLDSNILNVTGNLTNLGVVYFAGRGAGNTLDINAGGIFNSGVLSTVPGAALNLSLNSLNDIVNTGSITSGGKLNLTAGGSVSNSGSIQAERDIDISAGSVTNSGSVVSNAGNINVSALSNLVFDGTGGTVQATRGSINFFNTTGKGDLDLTGGNYYSQSLNLRPDCGWVRADVGDVSGIVNILASDAHFAAQAPTLQMGEFEITADPVLTNTGNIDVKSLKPVSGSDYVILAGGSITASTGSLVINTSSSTRNGGNVVLAAGVTYKGTTITGTSASGGNIDLSGIAAPGSIFIDTRSSKADASGGNVTIAAYTNPTGTFGGHVNVPGQILTSAGAGSNGSGGAVTIIANARSNIGGLDPGAVTINVGDIVTGAATTKNGTGAVNIATTGFNGNVVVNSGTGAITSGTFLGGAARAGAVSAGTITTNGGAVNISGGFNDLGGSAVTVSAINTGALTTGNGGAVNVSSGAGVNNFGGTGGVTITNGITTSAAGNGNKGGAVTVVSVENLSIGGAITTQGLSGASGGNVVVSAGPSATFTSPSINSSGASGGNVTLVAGSALTVPSGQTITTSATGAGGTSGNVFVAAGATASVGPTSTSISASSGGGDLALQGVGTVIDASATGTNAKGGTITLLAYRGSAAASGHVNSGTANVLSGGNGTGASGDVTAVGGANSSVAAPTTMAFGTLNTSGGLDGTGKVQVLSAQPSSLSLDSSAVPVTTPVSTNVQGVVSINNVTTEGGDVVVTAGSNQGILNTALSIFGAITTTSMSGDGGDVTLVSGVNGATAKADISVAGTIVARGSSDGTLTTRDENGGAVRILTPTNVTVSSIDTSDTGSATATPLANGGNVLIHAGSATSGGTVQFTTINTQGVSGGNVEIVAGNDITSSSSNPINASSRNATADANFGSGGAVTLIAGAFSDLNGNVTTIYGNSTTGGNINLSNVSGTSIDTQSNAAHGSGGSVRLIAYASGANKGHVTVAAPIVTKGSQRMLDLVGTNVVNMWSGAGGDVFVMAGGTSATAGGTGASISLNTIDTSVPSADPTSVVNSTNLGGAPMTGFVELLAATPNSTALSPVQIDNSNGKVSSGTFTGGANIAGAVSTGNITTTGGNVRISAGTNSIGSNAISTGAINTSVPASAANGTYDVAGSGGFVTLFAGLAGAGSANINVGAIGTQGYTGGAVNTGAVSLAAPVLASQGGSVNILTSGSVSTGNITTGDDNSMRLGVPNVGALGGNVLIVAGTQGTAGGNISAGTIQTKGFGGGTVELYSLGTGAAVSAGNIDTSSYSNDDDARAGAISVSSPGSISLVDITGRGITSGRGADVFLSAGNSVTVSGTLNLTGTNYTGYAYAITANGGSISTPAAFINFNNTAEYGSGAPSGGTSAIPDLVFFGTNVATSSFTHNAVAVPLFILGGGFTSFNASGEFINISTSAERLIIPLVSLNGDVNVSGGNWFGNAVLRFIGPNVNLSTTLPARTGAVATSSTGTITANFGGFNNIVGGMVAPSSVTITNTGDLSLVGEIIAPTVSLTTTQNVGSADIRGDSIVLTQELHLTTNLSNPVLSRGLVYAPDRIRPEGGVFQSSFRTVSGIDALRLINISVGSLDLSNVGSVLVDNTDDPLSPSIEIKTTNVVATLQILTNATSAQNGSIQLHGDIDGDLGNIVMVAAGSIYTTGDRTTRIHAIGRTGVAGAPTLGNEILMFAGTNWQNLNTVLTVPGRSGVGGDISLLGLDPSSPEHAFEVTTDINGSRGNIIVTAYANVKPDLGATIPAGVNGGNIFFPTDVVPIVDSPDQTSPNTVSGQGITIIGEAAGGDTPKDTITLGDVNAGITSLRVGTFTPNINTGTNPVSLRIFSDGGIDQGPGGIFLGNAVDNSSVSLGNVQILGTRNTNQLLQINCGGDLNIGSIRTIGSVGYTPQPGTQEAFSAGNGGKVQINANYDINILGDIYTFGGGGGGGKGDPGTGGSGGGAGGGRGGNGGDGGAISITSAKGGDIFIDGDINSSGGGGGGGGGGYFFGSAGGLGGAGGNGGSIVIQTVSATTGSLTITGSMISAGGGNGGEGGDGNIVGLNGYAGGGGGGGGSYGAGGGGGGGGGSQPQSSSGFGGAGGGGLAASPILGFFSGGGGGGGDVADTAGINGGTGLGGSGAGGYLGPFYGVGLGGSSQVKTGQAFHIPGDGVSSRGGDGGWYPVSIPGVTARAARGGGYGQPGEGAITLNPNIAQNGGSDGTAVSTGGGDGTLTINSRSYTTASEVYVGSLLYTNPLGSTGDIRVTGNQIVTGRPTFNIPASTLATAVVQAQGGNIVFEPSTTLQVYQGAMLVNAIPTTSTITVGANSQLTTANNFGARAVFYVGTIPTSFGSLDLSGVAIGKKPANVNAVTFTPVAGQNLIFYGANGFSASAPANTIYAFGSSSSVYFNAPSKNQIVLNGGVQIAASNAIALTSLDFTDPTVANNLINLQNAGVIGGKLTFTGALNTPNVTITGGNVVLYPFNLRQTLSSVDVPAKVTLTMLNFTSNNPLTVDSNASSTQPDTIISGIFEFKSTGGVPIDPSLTIVSLNQPTFVINSTGKVTSTGNFTLSAAGDVNISGPLSAVGNLTVSTQNNTAGDITIASVVIGKNIVLTTADATTPALLGGFFGTSGSVTAKGNLTINTSSFNLTSTKLNAAAGTLTIDNNNTSAPGADAISIAGAAPFNISVANLLALTAKTVQIGSLANTDGITVSASLNTNSKTTGGNFIGAKNLSLVTSGFVNGNPAWILGTKTLTIDAGTGLSLGAVTGGSVVASTDSGDVAVNGIISTPAGTTSLRSETGNVLLNGFAVGGGTTTTIFAGNNVNGATANINGKTVNLTANGAGGFGPGTITTNATTLTVNVPDTTVTVLDTAPSAMNLGASQTGGLTLNFQNKMKVTVTGAQNHGDLTLNFLSTDGGVILKNNVTVTGAATIAAKGTGTISQSALTFLFTAGSLNLSTQKGSIGTTSIPLQVSSPVLELNATGTTANVYVTDNQIATIDNPSGAGRTFQVIDTAEGNLGVAPSLEINAPITAGTIILKATNVTNGSMALNNGANLAGPLGAAKAITLQVNGVAGSDGLASNGTLTVNAPILTVLGGVGDIDLAGGVSVTAGTINLTTGGAFLLNSTFVAPTGKALAINKAAAGSINLTTQSSTTITAAPKASIGAIEGNVNGFLTVKSMGATPVDLRDLDTAGTFTISNPGGFTDGGTVTAPSIILSSTTGGIDATTNTSTLSANVASGSTGSVDITNLGTAPLTLNKSSAGSDFTLTTGGDLTTNGIVNRGVNTTTGNDISITAGNASGTAALTINGVITVSGGSATVRNAATGAGSLIEIKPSARITTLVKAKTVTPLAGAQVEIFLGASSAGTATTPPTGVVVQQLKNGVVTFNGSGTYTPVASGTASVIGTGANVTFNAPAGTTITIGKGALVKADPIWPVAPSAPAATSIAQPMNAQPAHLVVVSSGNGSVRAALNNVVQPAVIQPSNTTLIPAASAPTAAAFAPVPPAASRTEQIVPSADNEVGMPMTLQQNGEFVIDTDEDADSEELVLNLTRR